MASGTSFEARFFAMGMAYLEHAVADPVSYHLMFGELTGSGKHMELQAAADDCFSRLLKTLEVDAPLDRLEVSALELSSAVWAGVHGLASLLITDLHQSHDGRPDSQAGRALATLADNPERALRLLFMQWFRD